MGEPIPSDFYKQLQIVIFSGIGAYVFIEGAIAVAYYVALHTYLLGDTFSTDTFADPATRAGFASAIVSVVLGAALLCGARRIEALLGRLR